MRHAGWTRALFVAGSMLGPAVAVVAVACGSSGSGGHGSGGAGSGGSGGSTGTGHDAGTGGGAGGGHDGGHDGGMKGLTCGQLLTCDQPCNSDACTNACYGEATGVAQGLFDALTDCINENCSSADGGPCASPSSAACSTCNAKAATGPCIMDLEGCENNAVVGPPNGDAGAVMVNTDAGQVLNCGQLIACEGSCSGDAGACEAACAAQATAEAVALAQGLQACLAMACPSTDGGPCATPGLVCNGCIEQVELAQPDTCAAPYVACNGDTSNNPDGGASPTSLADGGALSTILTGLDQCASTLLISGGYLYFTQVATGGPVLRYALDGDAGYTTVGPPQPTPVGLAVDANNVYVWNAGTFTLGSSTNNGDGTVVQVPLNGGPAITLFQNMELFYDATYLNAIAVDSQYVYWVAGAVGNDGAIMKAPIGGGGPAQTLFTGQYIPQALVTDGTNVYWSNLGTFDSQGISNGDGTIWQGSVNGGTPTLLASNQPTPYGIAIDATNVYWANVGKLGGDNLPALNAGSIMKAPIGGGQVETIASSQAAPFAIVVQNGTIYWNQYGLNTPGLIMSAPTNGGAVVPLVAGLNDPGDIAVNGNTIFWANTESSATDGSILSLTLP